MPIAFVSSMNSTLYAYTNVEHKTQIRQLQPPTRWSACIVTSLCLNLVLHREKYALLRSNLRRHSNTPYALECLHSDISPLLNNVSGKGGGVYVRGSNTQAEFVDCQITANSAIYVSARFLEHETPFQPPTRWSACIVIASKP